jgi:hypothetical protein
MPWAQYATPKSIYLVVEDNRIVGTNTQLGIRDVLYLSAQERVLDMSVANGVAVVVTNQGYHGYGVFPSGWQSVRSIAGERLERLETEDLSALVVTNERILTYSATSGSWSWTRR